jgi:hypothetical protein
MLQKLLIKRNSLNETAWATVTSFNKRALKIESAAQTFFIKLKVERSPRKTGTKCIARADDNGAKSEHIEWKSNLPTLSILIKHKQPPGAS